MKTTLGLLVLFLLTIPVFGQEKTGDVILDAMQDELWQNKKELKLPELSPPFYLMYGVQDQKVYVASATLGAIIHYSERPNRFRTNTRILVGDYDFNDESLDDNHFSSPTVHEIELPVDGDYYGIRRSFWSSTDEVYRSAARHFKKHQQTVKESGKDWSEIPHRTFARSEPVRIMMDFQPFNWEKDRYLTLVKNLSAKFLGVDEIENSAVIVQFVEGQHYMVTTEGTIARFPHRSATLLVYAQGRTKEGEFINEELRFASRTPSGFPTEQNLGEQIDQLIRKLKEPKEPTRLDEEYSGPVLVIGSSVAESFANAFMFGSESLKANDNIAKLKGYQFDQSSSLGTKIGKAITHQSLTVKARPSLETYDGVELLGSFVVDGEAMAPAKETVLVENGVLKTLMDNRSITSASKTTYAHGFNDGPGVVEIVCSFKQSERELKDKLIQKAKAEGLEYAFIIRDKRIGGAVGSEVYRVNLDDGGEELVARAQFARPAMKNLRKLSGASSSYKAYNIGRFGEARNANVTSYIVPTAILLEEGEVKPVNLPMLKEEHFVSSPLVTP